MIERFVSSEESLFFYGVVMPFLIIFIGSTYAYCQAGIPLPFAILAGLGTAFLFYALLFILSIIYCWVEKLRKASKLLEALNQIEKEQLIEFLKKKGFHFEEKEDEKQNGE